MFNKKYRRMRKYMILGASLCIAVAFTGCKSSESAYRKMYEKAQAQDNNNQSQGAENVEKPATETTVVDNADNVPVRQESLSVVSGDGLKNFSVIVGSYSVRANAEGMQTTLKSKGYAAQIAYNSSNSMYRVVVATYDSKTDAIRSRNELRAQYPDAWLLYNKK